MKKIIFGIICIIIIGVIVILVVPSKNDNLDGPISVDDPVTEDEELIDNDENEELINKDWLIYRDDKFTIQHPTGVEVLEEGDLMGRVVFNFGEGCFLGVDGGPFGYASPDVEIDITSDVILIEGEEIERKYWDFIRPEDKEGFAFINFDYLQDPSYPHFMIYHSITEECLPTINEILSTFKFNN